MNHKNLTHNLIQTICHRKMLVSLIMGFSSGFPLLLTITLLQAWMKETGVDLGTIGMMSFVGLPYTLKFLWAPLVDRFIPPFLGRRRGWLLIIQLLLFLSILGLGFSRPANNLWIVFLMAFFITFFSATQDIIIDAYRREDLRDEELGLGSALYVNGYRVGMLLTASGGFILADYLSFSMVYCLLALGMVPGVLTTLLTSEPVVQEVPQTLRAAVMEPLIDYFSRHQAVLFLMFILLYKIGDTMASTMTIPFYLDLGFSKTEIGTVAKLFGFWATILGGFVGGITILKIGIFRALWIFGFLQAISTAGFSVLAFLGHHLTAFSAVIAFENLTAGMGSSAYIAFMATLTNQKFTATQYALLSSLMGIPRVIISAPMGFAAEFLGWPWFFICCVLAAIPGMLLLLKIAPSVSES